MNMLRALLIIIIIAAIAWLVWWDRAHPQVSFLASFIAVQIPATIALVLIAIRSRFLSQNILPFPIVFRGHALSIVGTLLLPARLGDFGKSFYFNALCEYPIPKGLALVVEERIWDFVVLAILAVGTLLYLGDNVDSAALAATSKILVGIAIAGVAILILLPKLAKRLPTLSKFEEKYGIFSGKSWRHMIAALIISILIWGTSLTILIAAYHYSGLPTLLFGQLIFLFMAATLGLAISITPGSIGTFEGAIVGVLVSYGLEWDAALAFAIGYRLSWLAGPILVAAIALLSDGKTLANMYSRNRAQP